MTDQVSASHILLSFDGSQNASSARTRDDALKEIVGLKTQVTDGAEFSVLAKEHSDCPSSSQGGDLGEFGRGMMVPEFEQAAFGMGVGEVSDVIETPFGYHLIHRTA